MRKRHLFVLGFLAILAVGCGKNAPQAAPSVRPEPQPIHVQAPTEGFYSNELGSPLFDLVHNAKRSIDVEIYQMWDPDFQQALREAIGRGVRIRVIIDAESLGSDCKIFEAPADTDKQDCKDLKALRERIVSSGGAFVRFSKETLCGKQGVYCFQHGKMAVADGETALVSSGNFNPTNFCNKRLNPSRCNRDYSMITGDRSVVAAIETIFTKDLAAQSYDLEAILTPEVAAKLTVSPLSMKPLVAFLESARKSVLIQNQYLKDREFNAAILAAAKRGVEVKLMTASACSFAPPDEKAQKEIREIYSGFDAAGISSRMFTRSIPVGGKPGYLHAKAMVVDGERAWVGSVNGSTTAITVNREFGLFFEQASEVGELHKIMLDDYHHRGAETWEESLRCAKDKAAEGRMWSPQDAFDFPWNI